MTVIPITCDNCGAKYKLPESFKGHQAKCQKCGSVIDVAKQRSAAAPAGGPAAPSPSGSSQSGSSQSHRAAPPSPAARPAAAARPAVDRSKVDRSSVERPAPAAPASKPAVSKAGPSHAAAPAAPAARTGRASKRGEAAAEDVGHEGGRRGRPARKKSNLMPLAASAIGIVALAVVAFIMFGGDDKPASANTAQTDATGKPAAAAPDKPADNAAKPADAAAKPADQPTEQPAPADAPAQTADPKSGDPAPAPAAQPPTDPAAAAAPTQPKKRWENVKGITSMADVRDPKSFPEVVWPASVDDAQKTEIRGLCDDVQNGGVVGIRAKRQLNELGFPALFGIVEKLRTLDYKTPEDSMVALEFNKLLEEMTGGMNAGFETVEPAEELDPRKAEYNTLTVGKWRRALDDNFPDAEAFKKKRAELLKKQSDDAK